MNKHPRIFVLSFFAGILYLLIGGPSMPVSIAFHDLGIDRAGQLKINDPDLRVIEVASGLHLPTQMTFLGLDDILVLEKNYGTVKRIINGNLSTQPLLDVDVANKGERGMLGIAVTKNKSHTYVFLYYTEARSFDGGPVVGNMLYRYELIKNELVEPKIIKSLPANSGPYHHGGAVSIGPDGLVYFTVGDIHGICEGEFINESCSAPDTQVENYPNGKIADGRAGILRFTQEGNTADDSGILGDTEPIDKYYAYGIRNSFGIDFDPLTGKLWDTENGPDWGDEINLVQPGFNSGWNKVQGIWQVENSERKGTLYSNPAQLTGFEGRGKYSAPEFIWNHPVGPTAIKFLSSPKYGKIYVNDLFVADSNFGNIYHFKLNENRTGFLLKGPLADKIAQTYKELDDVRFAGNFGIISDLEVGPDGLLYVLTYGSGKIFKIIPEYYTDKTIKNTVN
jgi:glucose/arabinose dehydrogenase